MASIIEFYAGENSVGRLASAYQPEQFNALSQVRVIIAAKHARSPLSVAKHRMTAKNMQTVTYTIQPTTGNDICARVSAFLIRQCVVQLGLRVCPQNATTATVYREHFIVVVAWYMSGELFCVARVFRFKSLQDGQSLDRQLHIHIWVSGSEVGEGKV